METQYDSFIEQLLESFSEEGLKRAWIKDHLLGYSEYWRKSKSHTEVMELAYALRALRKVAGHIGANIKTIEWSGMSDPTEGKIFINPQPALGQYPIPAGAMDVLVGIAAHEAFHCTEWSDWVMMKIDESQKALPPTSQNFVRQLAEIGEDIYLDKVTRGSVWYDYMMKARAWQSEGIARRDPSLRPTSSRLLELWEDFIRGGQMHDNLHPDYLEPLRTLISQTAEIIGSKGRGSVVDRSDYRVKLYLKLWETLSEFVVRWESEKPTDTDGVKIRDEAGAEEFSMEPDAPPSDTCPCEDEIIEQVVQEPGIKAEQPLTELPRYLASQINAALVDQNAQDITPLIEAVAGEETSGVLRTVFWNATAPCQAYPNPILVRRLKQIFGMQKASSFRLIRGLESGKLDGRRLHRAPIDGKIFKRKEITWDNSWNITLLVDASLSMGRSQARGWQLAEAGFATLYEGARTSNNNLDVLAYFERCDQCEVIRLLHGHKLHTILPDGRTPSGQAIIAAALRMPTDKRRLIIHVTDGETNCGLSVSYAVKFCRSTGIDLVTLGCGYDEALKERFQEQYGDSLYLLDSIQQVPEAMVTLLRRKLARAPMYRPMASAVV